MNPQRQPTLDDLLHDLNESVVVHGLEYYEKMVTQIPDTDVIDRTNFILTQCLDKRVLDVGCGGWLHGEIKKVATKCYGIDQTVVKDDPDFKQMVIGKDPIPHYEVDIVVCGEVIEHLSNPGLFLDELKQTYPTQLKIITVPNFTAKGHQGWVKQLKENVNKDHVAYYSYATMTNLLHRHGYEVKDFFWYDNPETIQVQGLNEGLVFTAT